MPRRERPFGKSWRGGLTGITQSTRAYEDWLRTQLPDGFAPTDLDRKHAKMRDSAFSFLRATYWRWAETVFEVCPELANAPTVLAVGDTHLENFGTWRDDDGRLVWGINDYDEAAEMPFVLDLVRLATSALLARGRRDMPAREVCGQILNGYRDGLAAPEPLVLEREYKWLRKAVVVPEKDRADFWRGIDKLRRHPDPPARFAAALQSAFPEPSEPLLILRRVAGLGSLGRLRLVGTVPWRGASVVREVKAVTPSAWTRVPGRPDAGIRCQEIATGRFRAPDPWFAQHGDLVVRRLSPNNRKIEVDDNLSALLAADMLWAMGRDLAAVQAGVGDRRDTLDTYLKDYGRGWLLDAAEKMASAVRTEYLAFSS
ncbi:DUF2252 family protein [Reyranella sp. CPCC 100927]|uniref:DUF2252 family protein n=1 Tax=Reyranella sp. CPCC 100927 TaxID=2599616 RepID=UPI0011B61881|nr:DUF2252 family protein [Reyranella sp. CPCC 100927]TWT05778.1 DUF2252 domain-containing protein [Reyranella sp. CPCC 100927]